MVYFKKINKELEWLKKPLDWKFLDDNQLMITAGAQTDLFIDPQKKELYDKLPKLLFEPDNKYRIQAKVKVNFKDTFDAGVIIIYADNTHWAKFCFEFSPQHDPTIVSVVTNEYSDDCNSTVIDNNEVYLRIARIDKDVYAFHYSLDKKFWYLVRFFSLKSDKTPKLGFAAQSPKGEKCKVIFSEIDYKKEELENIRDGS